MRGFEYDPEDRLVRITATNSFKSEFVYDGLGRKRVRDEYVWFNGAWAWNTRVWYVYDGALVIHERWDGDEPPVNYTRGQDLSGSRGGAGGIGGLLARSQDVSAVPSHNYYQADGNGNVAALMNAGQKLVAKYLYDPFGRILASSGPMAEANLYRFSSKEAHEFSGLVDYGARFYDPNLQRWLNQDPLGEVGGINLYGFVGNAPVNLIDPFGFQGTNPGSSLNPDAFRMAAELAKEGVELGWEEATGVPCPPMSFRRALKEGYQDYLKRRAAEKLRKEAERATRKAFRDLDLTDVKFKFKGAQRLDFLRDATGTDIAKAFEGTGLTPSGHFITRIKDPRLTGLGLHTFKDLEGTIRYGKPVFQDGGTVALPYGKIAVILDPVRKVLVTVTPWK